MVNRGPAKSPCGSCPYRQDVPSGVWAREEYEKLPPYDNDTADQPHAAFFCHQQDGHLCAGWVGCHDMVNSLGLRLASAYGELDSGDIAAAIDYVSPVPLWSSGAEAAAHGMKDLEVPGDAALKTVAKLTKKLESKAKPV